MLSKGQALNNFSCYIKKKGLYDLSWLVIKDETLRIVNRITKYCKIYQHPQNLNSSPKHLNSWASTVYPELYDFFSLAEGSHWVEKIVRPK